MHFLGGSESRPGLAHISLMLDKCLFIESRRGSMDCGICRTQHKQELCGTLLEIIQNFKTVTSEHSTQKLALGGDFHCHLLQLGKLRLRKKKGQAQKHRDPRAPSHLLGQWQVCGMNSRGATGAQPYHYIWETPKIEIVEFGKLWSLLLKTL